MTAPVIISPSLAERLREEAGFDVTGHPDFAVHDPHALGPLDIKVRPGTVTRMRFAAECSRMADVVRRREAQHGGG